jgi:uncharacterized protein (DUF1684 family)
MKFQRIIIVLVLAGVFITLYYSFNDSADLSAYTSSLIEERKNKDQFMSASKDSPFFELNDKFTALQYFAPNPAFRIQANLIYIKKREPRQLQTSDGLTRNFLSYAWAEFDFGNIKNKLLILEVMDEGAEHGNLFLAFADETSAAETYGGGRYLDIRKVPGSASVLLDFNKAYNPYCAYNNKFSCPLPPSENQLKIPIEAGEKVYKSN